MPPPPKKKNMQHMLNIWKTKLILFGKVWFGKKWQKSWQKKKKKVWFGKKWWNFLKFEGKKGQKIPQKCQKCPKNVKKMPKNATKCWKYAKKKNDLVKFCFVKNAKKGWEKIKVWFGKV